MADIKPRNQRQAGSAKPAAGSNQSKKKDSKPARRNIFKQVAMIYRFTKKEDPSITWWLVGAFVIPALIVVALGFVFHNGVVGWIFNVVLAIMLGILVMTMVLTNRSEAAGYRRLEGQPGATGAVLESINEGRFSSRVIKFTQQPVWVDPRTKNAIWRGTSVYGVYLVGEGPLDAINKAMDKEAQKIHHVTPGSDIPIYRICVGRGAGQTPLTKLRKALRKRHKIKFTMEELEQVNDRLRTLQTKSGLPIPKGVDPYHMQRVSRRAMRGK